VSPDENAVLSQGDIDALVSSSTEIGGETPASSQPQPAEPAPAAAPSGAQSAPAASQPNGSGLADVVQRLSKLEAAVSKMGQEGGGGQALAQELKTLSARVEEILQHLPNTLGYGLRSTFQCSSCGTQGLVAARILCTQCNTDTYAGWWPQT
jgi:hypothetical protein